MVMWPYPVAVANSPQLAAVDTHTTESSVPAHTLAGCVPSVTAAGMFSVCSPLMNGHCIAWRSCSDLVHVGRGTSVCVCVCVCVCAHQYVLERCAWGEKGIRLLTVHKMNARSDVRLGRSPWLISGLPAVEVDAACKT